MMIVLYFFESADLFIHQKCLFYLLYGSEKLNSFEISYARQKIPRNVELFRKLVFCMHTECLECLGKGCFKYFARNVMVISIISVVNRIAIPGDLLPIC